MENVTTQILGLVDFVCEDVPVDESKKPKIVQLISQFQKELAMIENALAQNRAAFTGNVFECGVLHPMTFQESVEFEQRVLNQVG